MIYPLVKSLLLTLLKAPSKPPPAPTGSPGSVQTFRASLKYLYYNLIVYHLGWIVPLGSVGIGAIAAVLDDEGGVALGLGILFVFLCVVCYLGTLAIRLEYDVRYYIVTDRAIRIREGIWTIKEITLTFANVQDLEITRGPIQQLLGIGDLFVRTAGGGAGTVQPQAGGLVGMRVAQRGGAAGLGRGHQAALRGIENASQVRDQISALLKQQRDAGLGDPEDARARHAAPVPVAAGAGAHVSPEVLSLLGEIRDGLRAYRVRSRGQAQRPAGQ